MSTKSEQTRSVLLKVANVICILLIVGLFLLTLTSSVFADNPNPGTNETDTIIGTLRSILETYAKYIGLIIFLLGLVDIYVSVKTEDTLRKKRGIIEIICSFFLFVLKGVIHSIIKKSP